MHAQPSGGPSDDPIVADDQQWRADMGLRSDAAYVAEIRRRHGAPDGRPGTWGHPLAPEEEVDLSSRGDTEPEVLHKIARYGEQHPDSSAGFWLDQSARGRQMVAFTSRLDDHRRELRRILGPQVEFSVVGRVTSSQELQRINDDVMAARAELDVTGGGPDEVAGIVRVTLKVVDDDRTRRLADRFPGKPICVDGPSPEDLVPEGPQAHSGDGWRLLADQAAGESYTVAAALDAAALDAIWHTQRLAAPPPPVDFEHEIALYFGRGESSGCPVRLDGVTFDAAARLVYANIVRPGSPGVCPSNLIPHSFVVAVPRDRLPPSPFTLQLGRNRCFCSRDADHTQVDVG